MALSSLYARRRHPGLMVSVKEGAGMGGGGGGGVIVACDVN